MALVRETGLEPVWKNHTPLKRARLPVPPFSQNSGAVFASGKHRNHSDIYYTRNFEKVNRNKKKYEKIFLFENASKNRIDLYNII